MSLESALSKTKADTIVIKKGVYHWRNVIISHKVVIIGENLPVIDAGGRGSIFFVRANNVTIKGLKLINSEVNYKFETLLFVWKRYLTAQLSQTTFTTTFLASIYKKQAELLYPEIKFSHLQSRRPIQGTAFICGIVTLPPFPAIRSRVTGMEFISNSVKTTKSKATPQRETFDTGFTSCSLTAADTIKTGSLRMVQEWQSCIPHASK